MTQCVKSNVKNTRLAFLSVAAIEVIVWQGRSNDFARLINLFLKRVREYIFSYYQPWGSYGLCCDRCTLQ